MDRLVLRDGQRDTGGTDGHRGGTEGRREAGRAAGLGPDLGHGFRRHLVVRHPQLGGLLASDLHGQDTERERERERRREEVCLDSPRKTTTEFFVLISNL